MAYNLTLARQLAPEITKHLAAMAGGANKYNYNRSIVRSFQESAALKADGLYGGETRGALLYFAPALNPPKPFFKPTGTIPYVSPEPEVGPVIPEPTYEPAPPPIVPQKTPVVRPPAALIPPKPAPKPAPVAVVPAPVPMAVVRQAVTVPKLSITGPDVDAWQAPEYGDFVEETFDAGSAWVARAPREMKVNAAALATLAAVSLTWWYGREHGWF
jgi:hypothetical protein